MSMAFIGSPKKPNSGAGLINSPSITPKKPTTTAPFVSQKEKLQSELAIAEKKLKWLNNNLVPVNVFYDIIPNPVPYKAVYYFIKVDGKKKNSEYKYVEQKRPWISVVPYFNPFDIYHVHSLANINKLKTEYKQQIATLKNKIATLTGAKPPATGGGAGGGSAKADDKKGTVKQGALVYNVAAVKDAYFSSERRSNLTLLGKDGNQTRGDILDPYLDLWKATSNHKGMISSWSNTDANKSPNTKNMAGGSNFKQDNNRYAFQFQYNPQPITMSYAGAPPVDIANFMSGQEEYALYTGGNGSGNITFDLVLNRIEDMKYYDATGNLVSKTDGTTVYPGRQPYGAKDKVKVKELFNEQEFIYNKGTMYDIEYLLRTVMGVTMESKFRGKTADFGWIGAMPVELHLGPGLRYWATMAAFTVNHVVFNERMVPIFSTVKISCNRLPDYKTNPTAASGGSGAGSGSAKSFSNLNAWDKKKALK